MIERLRFASCYAYAPRGISAISKQSQTLCRRIKRADDEAVRLAADRVVECWRGDAFEEGLFGDGVILVPAPGRAPLAPGAVDRAAHYCQALVERGLGAEVDPMLERFAAVPKSAYSEPADRPDVQAHYASMRVRPSLVGPMRVLIVDDVVTRGATLLAAASRIAEAYPACDVRGFALIRTISPGEVDEVRAPVCGTIELTPRGSTIRRP